MADRAPEEIIRDWLIQNGPTRVKIDALEQTWGIERLGASDRRRVAAALGRVGVVADPPLARLSRNEKVLLSIEEEAAPAVVYEPEPEPEEEWVEPEPQPQPEPEPRPKRRGLFSRGRTRGQAEPEAPQPEPEVVPYDYAPEPAIEPEAYLEPEPEPYVEAEPEPYLEPEPEDEWVEPEPAPEPEVVYEPEPEPELAEPRPQPRPKRRGLFSRGQTRGQADPEAPQPEPEVVAHDYEPEPAIEPDLEPEPDPYIEPEPRPETERSERFSFRGRSRDPARGGLWAEPEPELAYQPEPASDPDPVPDPQAAGEREPLFNRILANTSRTMWAIIAALALMVLGSLGPWAKAILPTDYGTDANGVFVLLAALLIGVLLAVHLRRGRDSWLPLVAAGVGAFAAAAVAADFRTYLDDSFVGPAWGLYVAFIGCVIAVAVSMSLLVRPQAAAATDD